MKLFVFDIDNTLISHCKQPSYIPETTKKALDMIKKAGHDIIIATGRSYNVTKHIMEELAIKDAVISNGSTVVSDMEIVFNKPIKEEAHNKFLDLIKEKRLPALAFDSHDVYIYNDIEKSEEFTKAVKSFIDPMYEGTQHEMKEFTFDRKYNSISIFDSEVINDDEEVSTTWYEEGGYELMDVDSTKATGILKYINENNIKKENVYVFGDNYNDISMFEEFYENSYVLGNASEEVKKSAKNICNHIDEDGIYNAVISILNN